MIEDKDREHRESSKSSPEIAKSTKSGPQSTNRNATNAAYLASFPELNPNPIIELDFEGHLSYLNPAARKLLPDLEILGGKHPFLVDWSKFVQPLQEAKQSEVISHEINFGNLIYEQAITLLPQNKIRFYAQDITFRKRAEEALMQSETYLRATLNSTEDGILVVDNHRTIITANDHFLEMFRIPRDLVIQKDDNPVLALVVGQMINPESFLNKVKQLYDSEIIDRDTLHLKDGRVIERYSEPLILQEKIAGRVWSFRDNTELILAEEGLKRSEEKYRLIVEKSTDIIFSFNFAGEFLYISPSIKNLLGYDPDDLIGHPFQSLVHPEDITGLQQAIQRNINDGSQAPGGNRFRVRNASGEWRWHSTTGNAVYDDNGKFAYFIAISRDITEHKKAEELLQATEQNFRNSLDGSPMGIRIIDSERRSLYVNQEFLNIFGYKNIGEVGDYPLQAHYTPEEHLKFLSRQEKRNHGKQIPENIRVEIKSKDGIIRYLEVSDSEVVWNGKPHREIIYEDVTESELAKKALQESEEKYKLIVENSTDIIFTLDIAGRFIYLSPSIKNVLGYAPLELIGVPFHSLVHPDDMHVIDEAELLHHEPGVKFFKREEYRFRDASGQWRWLSSTGTPMREGYEKTFNFVGVARDITQQKKSEEALIASEVNYRRLFESSKDGILIINAVTGLITDVNPYLVDLLGFAPKEFIGKALWEIGAFKDIVANIERFQELLEKKYVSYEDLPLETIDGRQISVEFVSNVYEVDHRRVIQCNIRNITERNQAEKEKKELEDKAQVASRLAAIGEMAAGVAHEINNPLTGVLGFSQMLLEKENVPEDIKADLKLIADGSQRVADIVKRLLTFARQTKPIRALANINELIDNTLKLREYVLKTSNIEVITRFDKELPLSVVDPGQMQQVFLNLIVNAEQAMTKANGKGTLTITTEKNGNFICISFLDDGPGITRENLKHLFEPFFTTKEPGEGTGLGLSLSRSIVLEHGGRIHVESKSGHGANFIVEIPIIESPQLDNDPQPSGSKKSKITQKTRILVVDDEPGVREFLERVFIQLGHSIEAITDASTAENRLDAGAIYDVILLDVRMPGISGTEFYQRIIEKNPALKHKVIIITGDVMGSDIKEFLKKNSLPYLAKPFDIKVLKEQVEAIVTSN